MNYAWKDYDPETMGYVEKWLDRKAVKLTGMDDLLDDKTKDKRAEKPHGHKAERIDNICLEKSANCRLLFLFHRIMI